MIPGEYFLKDEDIELNQGREHIALTIVNTGDRPIQVGSHYHFYEVNEALSFDRNKAYGRRLDIPSGTAVRFEPGLARTVYLIDFGGSREIYGFQGKVNGRLEDKNK